MSRERLVRAALVAVVLLASGCSSAAAGPKPTALPTNDATLALQQQADLAPCPAGDSKRAGGLPEVTVACLGGGRPVRLAHITGTPMIVNIWASWCRPCYQEMPAIQQVYAAAGSKLSVIGVDSSDNRDPALHTAIDTGTHYPSVYDPDRKVVAALGLNAQPATIFLRSDGSIAHIKTGPVGDAAALRSLVQQYLGVRL